MTDYKLKTGKMEEKVTDAYKSIEDGVVGAYKKIEDGVVGAYKKIEDKFVDTFLEKKDDEEQSNLKGEEIRPFLLFM